MVLESNHKARLKSKVAPIRKYRKIQATSQVKSRKKLEKFQTSMGLPDKFFKVTNQSCLPHSSCFFVEE